MLTLKQKENLVEKHRGLANKIAQNFTSKQTQLPFNFQDMLVEADFALTRCVYTKFEDKYDSTKGAESTFFYQSIYWHLQTVLQNYKKAPINFSRLGWELHKKKVKKENFLENLTKELSDEAYQVLSLIINAPKEVLDLTRVGTKTARKRTIQELKMSLSWTQSKIEKNLMEIEQCL